MSRPSDKPNWINDGTTGIEVPTPAEQDAGWDDTFTTGLKPPRQWFNWFQNRVVLWRRWLSGQAGEYIVIDSTAGNEDERDYETLADYIADSPSAGDKVLVKTNQVLTAQMVIPSDITLRIIDGVVFTRSTLDAASVIQFGSNWIIEGILNLILSQTGTTAKAIEINGDNGFGDIIVENSSTGTLTDAFAINAGKKNNFIRGITKNTGGGAITNDFIDNSAVNSNSVLIAINATAEFARSNGIIFENDIRDVSRNLVIKNTVANPTFQMDIDVDEVILQNDAGAPFRATSVNETADITASGANGLDTGSEAGSTWYFLWVIAKADGTVDSLLSLSSTAPTMPSGYTFKALVGAIYNDGSSDFINISQVDGKVVRAELQVLANGSSGTYASISLIAALPSTAKTVHGTFGGVSAVSQADVEIAATSTGLGQKQMVSSSDTATSVKYTPYQLTLVEAQTMYYRRTANNCDVFVSGWEY